MRFKPSEFGLTAMRSVFFLTEEIVKNHKLVQMDTINDPSIYSYHKVLCFMLKPLQNEDRKIITYITDNNKILFNYYNLNIQKVECVGYIVQKLARKNKSN